MREQKSTFILPDFRLCCNKTARLSSAAPIEYSITRRERKKLQGRKRQRKHLKSHQALRKALWIDDKGFLA